MILRPILLKEFPAQKYGKMHKGSRDGVKIHDCLLRADKLVVGRII